MSTTGDAPETITRDELAEAMRNVGSIADLSKGLRGLFEPGTDDLANAIFGYVAAHREPAYEPGEAYQDQRGHIYLRSSTGDWVDYSGVRHGGSFPLRPLRRLVPEGSPLADSERDLIHADLGKLLDLLGLGDYARPQSSHEVFLTCLEEVAKLKRWTNA